MELCRKASILCYFCMTVDLEEESYICYAFWVPYPPSEDENSKVKDPPLSYIKSCVVTCTLKILTSFVSLPKQKLV